LIAERNVTTRHLQYALAAVFFVLGGWCVVAPENVIALGVRPAYRSDAPIVPLLVACFGSQALISGLFAATSRFSRTTFLVYGIALLPFFVFDAYFYAVKPILTEVGLVDFIGNLVMVVACWFGWKRAPAAA
jgi:predicted membrane channel-forming protein YqfA (hemolysin III family)